MGALFVLVLLFGAPAFTAGLIAGEALPELPGRTRASVACALTGMLAGLVAVLIVTAGQALGYVTYWPFLALGAWNALVGMVGAATGYGYGWMLTGHEDSRRPHRRWMVVATVSAAASFLLVCWIVSSLDTESPAMAATPEPSVYVPPPHLNHPDYTLPAGCVTKLRQPPAGSRLPECQWLAIDGDVAWVQDQAQQVFEWGDTCGFVLDSHGTPVSWDHQQLARCLDPALPPLERSATRLAARIDQVAPVRAGACRSAVLALRPWPQTILQDAAALDAAANRGDAATVKSYLAKLDRDLSPGTLGYGRISTRCRLV